MTDTNQQPTFDRVEELVATITDIFQHTHNPNTDEWELSGDLDQYPAYNALTELATIAREAEKNAEGQEANAVFALSLKRDAEAEAEKWRKVAEAGKRMAAAYEPIRCNLDPVDSGCDDPCHRCSLAQAVRAHNEFSAALARLEATDD